MRNVSVDVTVNVDSAQSLKLCNSTVQTKTSLSAARHCLGRQLDHAAEEFHSDKPTSHHARQQSNEAVAELSGVYRTATT